MGPKREPQYRYQIEIKLEIGVNLIIKLLSVDQQKIKETSPHVGEREKGLKQQMKSLISLKKIQAWM